MKQKNILAQKFNFASLLKFSMPTVAMMIFLSMYTMVDGAFVSRFVSTSALSAVNLVYPIVSVVIAVGVMLAAGGSAVLAKEMGEGKALQARQHFTFIVLVGVALGLLITVLGLTFIQPLLRFLGANEALYPLCRDYMMILLVFVPMSVLQVLFQTLFVTAGHPGIGLAVTLAGGLANVVLDYVFIVPMQMGIGGAALATGIGYCIPAVFGLVYFSLKRRGTLFFVKPRFDATMLLASCSNGSSEMVTNLSTAVTTLLFNIMMMQYMGEDGVAAITIVLYAQFFLMAVYLGYSTGVAPVISYNFGRQDAVQLKSVFKTSLWFIGGLSVLTFLAAEVFSGTITSLFTSPASPVYGLAVEGFHLFAYSFLFVGINVFASALFTAFSNGKVSALLSFLRTFVFIVLALLLLPQFIGIAGIWLAIPLAELLGILFSAFFLVNRRKIYQYA